MTRSNWDQYFFDIAHIVKSRSTCQTRAVGAVIVNPHTKNIIATGYNGAPRGMPHCDEECASRESGKDYHKCQVIHGEINAIVAAARNGVSTDGADIYLTCTPCKDCAKVLINAGIATVYANGWYSDRTGGEYIEASDNTNLVVIDGHFGNPSMD
jgi:dCMP deaminase